MESVSESEIKTMFPRGIKKVLWITPPDADASLFRVDTALRGRYTNYPPYGLGLLSAQARAHGVQSQILNLNHLVLKEAHSPGFNFDRVWQSSIEGAVSRFKPDLIGVTCMFTMTHESFKSVCKFASGFKIPIALGGVHVSNDLEHVMKEIPWADFAFLKEADHSFPLFLEFVSGKIKKEELAQVAIRVRMGETSQLAIFSKETQPTPQEMDILPDYNLMDLKEYSSMGTIGAFYCFKPKDTTFATVLSNRGCRARCTFCSVRNFNGSGVRQRSIESVIEELKYLKNEQGVGHIMWLDDDLLFDQARAIRLFNEMVRQNLNLTWDATNGVIAFSCTKEMIDAASKSGCIALNIGMESGNAKILNEIKKPGKVDTFLRAAEVLRAHPEIFSSVFLMIGFPGETLKMIMDTLEVGRQMDLDWYRIAQLQPLPNTPIYDAMIAQGLIKQLETSETRFMAGAYGKQVDIEGGQRLATQNFREAFGSIGLDQIPTAAQIEDIWFYLNYHLNFKRLFNEKRPLKIAQQQAMLRAVSDIIAPENGFALYFLGYLQKREGGAIDPEIISRLEQKLKSSPYWRDRLAAFGLDLSHLKSGLFPAA